MRALELKAAGNGTDKLSLDEEFAVGAALTLLDGRPTTILHQIYSESTTTSSSTTCAMTSRTNHNYVSDLMRHMPEAYNKTIYEKFTASTRALGKLDTPTKARRQQEEKKLHDDEVLDMFIIMMKEPFIAEWIARGTLPNHNVTNHTDIRQGNFNFHTKNDPTEVKGQTDQLDQTCNYMLMVQTRKKTLEHCTTYMKHCKRSADSQTMRI
eukprot:412115-Amphidinium_carterae.1